MHNFFFLSRTQMNHYKHRKIIITITNSFPLYGFVSSFRSSFHSETFSGNVQCSNTAVSLSFPNLNSVLHLPTAWFSILFLGVSCKEVRNSVTSDLRCGFCYSALNDALKASFSCMRILSIPFFFKNRDSGNYILLHNICKRTPLSC